MTTAAVPPQQAQMSGSSNGDQEKLIESSSNSNITTSSSNNSITTTTTKNRSVSPSPRKTRKNVSIANTIFAYVSSSWVRNELTEDWNNQPWLVNNKIHRQKKRKTIIPISTAYDMSIIQKYLTRLVTRGGSDSTGGANILLPSATEPALSSSENEVVVKGLSTYFNCNEAAVLDTFSVLVAPYAPATVPVFIPDISSSSSTSTINEKSHNITVKRESFSYSERTVYPDDVVASIPEIGVSTFPGILTNVPPTETRKTSKRVTETSTGVHAAERLAKGTFVCEMCGVMADPRKIDEEIASQNSVFEAPLIADDTAYTGVFFYPAYPQCTFCIDARTSGNASHSIRRSCTPNAEFRAFASGAGETGGDKYVRLGLFALQDVTAGTELTVAFDYCWRALSKQPKCPCGKGTDSCEVARWFDMRDKSFAAAYGCVQKLIYIDPPVAAARGAGSVTVKSEGGAGTGVENGGGDGMAVSGGSEVKGGRGGEDGRRENTPKKGKKRQGYMAGLETPEWVDSRDTRSSREDRKIRLIEETFRKMEKAEKKKEGLPRLRESQRKKQRKRGGGGGDGTSESSESSSPSNR